MTAEEYRLIAFLLGETEQSAKDRGHRVPRPGSRALRRNARRRRPKHTAAATDYRTPQKSL